MSSHSDESLKQRLQEFRVTPSSSPNFRNGVWQRIDGKYGRPALKKTSGSRIGLIGVACLLTFALSGWTGLASAKMQAKNDRVALATNYLKQLDARSHVAHEE